jgi:hypothetical protein
MEIGLTAAGHVSLHFFPFALSEARRAEVEGLTSFDSAALGACPGVLWAETRGCWDMTRIRIRRRRDLDEN